MQGETLALAEVSTETLPAEPPRDALQAAGLGYPCRGGSEVPRALVASLSSERPQGLGRAQLLIPGSSLVPFPGCRAWSRTRSIGCLPMFFLLLADFLILFFRALTFGTSAMFN